MFALKTWKKLGSALAAAVLTLLAASAVSAHTYHSSLARMDYDAGEKSIQISLQLFIHDVLPMIERRTGKRIDIEKSPEVDGEVLKYIRERFVFIDPKGAPRPVSWVGKEFENDVVYVFVEIPYEGSFEGASLQNTLFFEAFPEQTNLVIARLGDKKTNLTYKSGDKIKAF